MKKFKWLSLLMLLLLVLGACSDSDKEKTDNTEKTNETAESKEKPKVEEKKALTHNYPYFDVKIEFIGGSYYHIKYDHAGDVANTKFEVTVSREEKNLTGQEAYDFINPILEQLTFDATTTQISTLSDIVKKFGMPNGRSKYNVDVRLADGTEIKYVK